MSRYKMSSLASIVPLMTLMAPAARAQFAVIDVASVAQLVQQVSTLAEQLDTLRNQYAQAQAQYQSMTGSRGMEQLLRGTVRNYLPTDWASLNGALSGGAYAAFGADMRNAISANALLSPDQLALLPADAQAQIEAARRSVAMAQALAEEALSNTSSRFGSIQQLINAIPTAADEKGILDLQARIDAEQGMLQNEQTKLQVLYQAAQAQQRATQQRAREQIIASHGHFATRFEPAPR